MDERPYLDAIAPEQFQVLRVRLLPFSLGHLVLLKRLEVAFVSDREPDISDVILTAWVCSRSFEEARDSIDALDCLDLIGSWGRRLMRPTLAHRLRLRRAVRVDWVASIQLLCQYIDEAHRQPEYIVPPGKSGELAAPTWQIIRITLMRDLHLSDSEVMNRPYRLCRTDYLTIQAREGHISMVDADGIADAQKFAVEFARRMSERPAKN